MKKITVIVVVAILGAGGYFGNQLFRKKYQSCSPEQLLSALKWCELRVIKLSSKEEEDYRKNFQNYADAIRNSIKSGSGDPGILGKDSVINFSKAWNELPESEKNLLSVSSKRL